MQKIEDVMINGDLQNLQPDERVMYYKSLCESQGLNPLTKPFEYIRLNGKLTLYARKDCTDQLRALHDISIKITAREKVEDVYIVTAQASNKTGRCDESTGAVNIGGLKGESLANALMKSETKAKRRVTLSIAGLGFLDEQEVESSPNAIKLNYDLETGEIKEPIKAPLQLINTYVGREPLDLLKTIEIIMNDGDRLAMHEFCTELSKEEKQAVWPMLDKVAKDWIKDTMDNAPVNNLQKLAAQVKSIAV